MTEGMCSVFTMFAFWCCTAVCSGHRSFVSLFWRPQELGVAFGSSDKREAELLKEEQAKAQTALKARAGGLCLM